MKNAIIIGASSGIGKELAKQLNQEYHLILTARRIELLRSINDEWNELNDVYYMDVTNVLETKNTLDMIIKQFSTIDLVIYSSGTGFINETLDFELEKSTIDVNVYGFTFIADYFTNLFKQQGFGTFVSLSSIACLRGSSKALAYNATKSYMSNYLEGLSMHLKNEPNIQIFDVRPGLVDTAMAKGEGLFWVQPTKKVVQQILLGMKKRKRIIYVTKRWKFIAYLYKVLPYSIYKRMG